MSRASTSTLLLALSWPITSACRSNDPWEEVDAVCEWETFFAAHPPFEHGILYKEYPDTAKLSSPAFPHADCVAALADAAHVDLEGFEEVSRDAMPLGRDDLLDGIVTYDEEFAPLTRVMLGLRTLYVLPFGDLDELRPSDLVSHRFRDELVAAAPRREGAVANALFRYLTDHAEGIRPATPAEESTNQELWETEGWRAHARFELGAAEIVVFDTSMKPGLWMLSVLLHEATHAWAPNHRTFPEVSLERGDPDIHGCHGFSLATVVTVARELPAYGGDVQADISLLGQTTYLMGDIASFLDADGKIEPRWFEPGVPFDYDQ